MNIRADISSVLTQMRDMQAQVQNPTIKPVEFDGQGIVAGVNKTEAPSFGGMLKQAIDGVNDTQMKAGALSTAYEQGVEGVELTQVMISMQKADVSFQAMTQVRNRFVSAYENIMNMPI